MARLQRYGDSNDWWILGSTNYAVVDPRKPEGSGELAKKPFKPQKQRRGLSKLILSDSVYGSTIMEALDDLFLKESVRLLQFPSRASAGPPSAKLPSFRALFQQQQTGRRHLSYASSFLATSSKGSFLRAPTQASFFEQLPSGGLSRSYDSAAVKQRLSSVGGPLKEEGGEGALRSFAKERLKRSVTRMRTASVSFMEAEDEADTTQEPQTETVDTEPLSPEKVALNALKRLERHARELQTQRRNLRRAEKAVESLGRLMRLESGGGRGSGEALSPLSRGLNSPLGFDMLGLLSDFSPAHHDALERTESEGETAAAQQRRELLQCLKRLAKDLQAASDFEAASRKAGAPEIGLALTAYEALTEAWDSRPSAFSLVLPAALASLACATAYSICAVACMEVNVQTLHSNLMRWGLDEGQGETAVNYLRFVTAHTSLLEHQRLLTEVVLRTLGLVLARERSSPKPHPPPSPMQEEEKKEEKGIHSFLAAAQSAISAAHEAAGFDGKAVRLEAEAQRLSLINKNSSLQRLLFCVLELRLHLNKLFGLRLALSEQHEQLEQQQEELQKQEQLQQQQEQPQQEQQLPAPLVCLVCPLCCSILKRRAAAEEAMRGGDTAATKEQQLLSTSSRGSGSSTAAAAAQQQQHSSSSRSCLLPGHPAFIKDGPQILLANVMGVNDQILNCPWIGTCKETRRHYN
ncbi:hypothetical protein ACSSS7_006611 [Eimeria intestinalis]